MNVKTKLKNMEAMKKKLKQQAGFTLVELLVVVAIVAILAAVAIPAFTNQMQAARRSVDEQALGSATSMAATDYLLNNYQGTVTYIIVEQNTAGATNGTRNLAVRATASSDTNDAAAFANNYTQVTGWGNYTCQSDYTFANILIQIGPGGIIAASQIS